MQQSYNPLLTIFWFKRSLENSVKIKLLTDNYYNLTFVFKSFKNFTLYTLYKIANLCYQMVAFKKQFLFWKYFHHFFKMSFILKMLINWV